MRMETIILGIDPGSRNTGTAVLLKKKYGYEVLHCGVLKVGHEDSHVNRLKLIHDGIQLLINEFEPISCAIETPLYGKDPLALLKLGRAQAAAMMAAISCNIPVSEYYPKMVKKSITGNGNATKSQVAYMLDKILALNGMAFPADATDALAVAWCHCTRSSEHATNTDGTKKSHQNNAKDSWAAFVQKNPDRIIG
jgi:crossover junction endodeoxyribonuclease RuvC